MIANDPDADRLAVAVPADVVGGWRSLSGNEVGLLLGWRAARRARDASAGPEASLACSLVSSPGLRTIAESYGLAFHETLTGFKWISRAPGMVFGFEEALGYLVNPETVRDKDGISAAVAILGLAAEARGRGMLPRGAAAGVRRRLRAFRERPGVDPGRGRLDHRPRSWPRCAQDPPTHFGEPAVTGIDDLLLGVDGFPPGDVLRLWLADGSRVIVRPSGTEPKLKVYLDARGRDPRRGERTDRRARGRGARAAGLALVATSRRRRASPVSRPCVLDCSRPGRSVGA